MATAHVWPFDTVGSGRNYDSDPFYKSPVTAPGAVTKDEGSKVTWLLTDPPQPVIGRVEYAPNYGAKPQDSGPDVWDSAVLPSRYPPPERADLVTLWKQGSRPVLSITAGGRVHDYHLPPARLVTLLREVADMISEHSILQ